MIDGTFDASRFRWKEVTGRPGSRYKIHHDYTILGYDRDACSLDMVVRWQGDGGHCQFTGMRRLPASSSSPVSNIYGTSNKTVRPATIDSAGPVITR